MGLDAGFRNLIAVEDLATIADEDERKAKLTERVKGMKKLFDAEVAKEVAKAKAEFLKSLNCLAVVVVLYCACEGSKQRFVPTGRGSRR